MCRTNDGIEDRSTSCRSVLPLISNEYYCVGKTVDEVLSLLQIGIREISEWCQSKSLTIHPAKSEIMIVSNKRFIGPLFPVKLGDNIIKVVTELKCLGVSH